MCIFRCLVWAAVGLLAACTAATQPAEEVVAKAAGGLAGLRASAVSDSSIMVRWHPPSTPLARIVVERKGGASAEFVEAAALDGGALTWTADGLAPATLYYFRVRAEPVDAGLAVSSATVGARTLDAPPALPEAPRSLEAARLSEGEGLLTWDDASHGTAHVLVERSVGDAPFEKVASRPAGVSSWLDAGAPLLVRARYRVIAENAAGRSPESNVAELAPVGSAPEAPIKALATVQGAAVALTWVDLSDDETGFVLERDDGAGFTALASVPANGNQWLDTTVAAGASYRYRVRAENAFGRSAWAETNAVTVPPPVPSRETLSGSAGGLVRKVLVDGTRAYVAESDELRIYDISAPASPVRLGSLFTGDGATLGAGDEVVGLAVSGHHVFLAASNKGLLVVDVSTPAHPRLVAERTVAGGAWSLAVSGTTLYVAAQYGGVSVFDVSNPAVPAPAASLATVSIPNGPPVTLNAAIVRVLGGRLLVAHRGPGSGPNVTSQLVTFALSQPRAPVALGAASFSGTPSGLDGDGTSVAVAVGTRGLVALVVDGAGLPTVVGTALTRDAANDVRCAGRFHFVADGLQGLTIVERSLTNLLVEVGRVDTAGDALGVDLSATHAFVADGYGGLATVSVGTATMPSSPALVAETGSFGSFATGLAVANGMAYVADIDRGLALVDVSDPAAPALRSVATSVFDANGVAVAGTSALVAEGDYGAARVDVDPASPTYLQVTGSVSNQFMARGRRIAASGRYAYLANGSMGVRVFDLGTRPGDPFTHVGSLAVVGSALDVAVAGSRLYVAAGDGGVVVADVSTPAAPVLLTTLTSAGNAYAVRVAVDDQRLFVSQMSSGLALYDVSGALPVRTGTYLAGRGVESVAAAGSRVYVLTGDGFERIDVSNPAAITLVRSVSLGAAPMEGVLVGDLLHLAVSTSGLKIFRVP